MIDSHDVRLPLRVRVRKSIARVNNLVVGVAGKGAALSAVMAFIPESTTEEELKAAKEWLLNFTYLCLEEE